MPEISLHPPAHPTTQLAVVGTGRLAHALLRTIQNQRVALLSSRGVTSSAKKILETPPLPLEQLAEFPIDTLWLAVSDSAITPVSEAVAGLRQRWDGITVIHSSGVQSLAALGPLTERGATAMVLHPNASLTGLQRIPEGITWRIEPDNETTRRVANRLLEGIIPRFVAVPADLLPLYHAAASLASNLSMTLHAVATELYHSAGVPPDVARQTVTRFLQESAERMEAAPFAQALTGPIARGDMEVVRRQLQGVKSAMPEMFALFQQLCRATVQLRFGQVSQGWEDALRGE
ncbi:MAG: DUF2520 domain-containing protein [Armatimonadetes bacterium]|nr:DUF2520 domain-containing protein [Armatimonadota bacterium]